MINLPNNRLILNWHRILTANQFYSYMSKKFKSDIKQLKDLSILNQYDELKIAIWHAWSFLEKETKEEHDIIVDELSKYWEIKQTWIK